MSDYPEQSKPHGAPERDAFTGTETTGHEWDGIKELNTPLPRWWVWVFILCIIWSVGYWWVMPAWPTLHSFTQGSEDWSSREQVMQDVQAGRDARAPREQAVLEASLTEIQADPALYQFAQKGGKSAFGLYCAQCHGAGAAGAEGIANLNDDSWIWGGTLADIQETIRVGVRSEHPETRYNMMPSFDGLLSGQEVSDVADYVLSLSAGTSSASMPGATMFEEQCAACHGMSGEGDRMMGGPRLSDAIWLYGGTKEHVMNQILHPRHGMMPTWEVRLDPATIKQLAIYVHALGGGEAESE